MKHVFTIIVGITATLVAPLHAGVVFAIADMHLDAQPTAGDHNAANYTNTHGEIQSVAKTNLIPYALARAEGSTDVSVPLFVSVPAFTASFSGGVETVSGFFGSADALTDTSFTFQLDDYTNFHFEGSTSASPGDGGSDQTISVIHFEGPNQTGAPGGTTLFAFGTGDFPFFDALYPFITSSAGEYTATLIPGGYTLYATTWTRSHGDVPADLQTASFQGSMSVGSVPEPSTTLFGIVGFAALLFRRTRK